MGFLEEMMGEINSKGQNKGAILKLEKNSKVKIRFLNDGQNVLKLITHGRFVKGEQNRPMNYTVPCPKQYGFSKCPFCGKDDPRKTEGGRVTQNRYGFVVYSYEDSEIKVILEKANMTTAIETIGTLFMDLGTLLDNDFMIRRNDGETFEIRHAVTNLNQSPFKFADEVQKQLGKRKMSNQLDVYSYIKEVAAKAWCPILLEKDKESVTWPEGWLRNLSESNEDSEIDDELLPGLDDDEE